MSRRGCAQGSPGWGARSDAQVFELVYGRKDCELIEERLDRRGQTYPRCGSSNGTSQKAGREGQGEHICSSAEGVSWRLSLH